MKGNSFLAKACKLLFCMYFITTNSFAVSETDSSITVLRIAEGMVQTLGIKIDSGRCVKLSGGELHITGRSNNHLSIASGSGLEISGNGKLVWYANDKIETINNLVNEGLISWRNASTEMPFSIWQKSWVNSKGETLYAITSSQKVYVWAAVKEKPKGEIIIDYAQSHFPAMTIKRGLTFNVKDLDDDLRNYLINQGVDGFKVVNFYRHLEQDNTEKAESFYGSPLPEFYMDNGIRKYRIDSAWLETCRIAHNAGLEIFCQATRLPGERGVNLFTPDPDYTKSGSTELASQSICIPQEWDEYANLVGNWMVEMNNEVGAPIIWTGADEVAFTIGFYQGAPDTDTTKLANIFRYMSYWKGVADILKASGGKAGGGCLNGSNAKFIEDVYARAKLTSCPMDFLCSNQYKGDDSNEEMLASAREAKKNTDFEGGKVFFNRYSYGKGDDSTQTTSSGICSFLNAEIQALDYADVLYGYAMNGKGFANGSMLAKVGKFVNDMPQDRKVVQITSGNGLNCFSSADSTGLYAVVWNNGTEELSMNISVNNGSYNFNTLSVIKGSGATMNSVPSKWDNNLKKLNNLNLKPLEFALIKLK